jgi:lysophospholipid acyltransferase (LPLAT)-like uncharacterized protein
LPERYIYAVWHENMLVPVYHYAGPDIYVLVSGHADGRIFAAVCHNLRVRTISGSTTRGGVEALRQLLRAGRGNHLALTPDGPRGPRRQVQPGLVYLAARTGLAIVPIGIGYDRPWRLRSWDRFAVPKPWSRATCVTTPPICVPADITRDQLAHYRRLVEDALNAANDAAERWAETGKWSGVRSPGSVAADAA